LRLLDTTVAVDYLRGAEPAVALLRESLLGAEDLAASELVRFELLAGAREDELTALEQFFSAIAWVPVSESIVRLGGSLAQRHRAAFSGINDADYLIAATAIALDARLLTTNVRHFPMLGGLEPAY
jgi:predicted nucleic acid-binding protein